MMDLRSGALTLHTQLASWGIVAPPVEYPQVASITTDGTEQIVSALSARISRAEQVLRLTSDPKWVHTASNFSFPSDKVKELSLLDPILPEVSFWSIQGVAEYVLAQISLNALGRVVSFFALTLLHAYQLELDNPPRSSYQAQSQLMFFKSMLESATQYYGWLQSKVKSPYLMSAAVAGTALGSVVLYQLLMSFKQSIPSNLAFAENLSQRAREGSLRHTTLWGRDSILAQITSAFAPAEQTMRRPIFLIGPTGCGKTAIVEGLAQAIERGDVPERLKGKTVFMLNTAALVGNSYTWSQSSMRSMPPLDYILEEIRGKEDQVILFFDEIQAARARNASSNLIELLKTRLDGGQIDFIIATTDREYQEGLVENVAFTGRFEKVYVDELKGPDLQAFLEARYTGRGVSSDVIAHAIHLLEEDETRTTAFPRCAIQLLDRAVSELRIYRNDELARDLETNRCELAKHKTRLRADIYRISGSELDETTAAVSRIEESIRRERSAFEAIWKLRDASHQLEERVIALSQNYSAAKTEEAQVPLRGEITLILTIALPLLERLYESQKESFSQFNDKVSEESVSEIHTRLVSNAKKRKNSLFHAPNRIV